MSLQGCASVPKPQKPRLVSRNKINRNPGQIHPIFHNKNWLKPDEVLESFSDPDTTKVVYQKASFYVHPTRPWFLVVYKIFGQEVLRTYEVEYESENLVQHWIMLKRFGKWYLAESNHFEFKFEKDNSGKIFAIWIDVLDRNGDRVMVTDLIKRK